MSCTVWKPLNLFIISFGFILGFTPNTSDVEAYVISETSLGDPTYWYTHCIPIWLSASGSISIDQDIVETELLNSLTAWDQPNCTILSFTYQGEVDSNFVGYDSAPEANNYNLVTFASSQRDWLYDPAALGLTTVTMCINDTPECPAGTIVDADIEINEAYHTFTTSNQQQVQMDLANTLTHEIGHLIGLDHSPLFEAIMYFQQPLGETIKRDLAEDDLMAVCDLFPLSDGRECSLDSYIFGVTPTTSNPSSMSSSPSEDQGCGQKVNTFSNHQILNLTLLLLSLALLRFRARSLYSNI